MDGTVSGMTMSIPSPMSRFFGRHKKNTGWGDAFDLLDLDIPASRGGFQKILTDREV
jgi:hypothetical protein